MNFKRRQFAQLRRLRITERFLIEEDEKNYEGQIGPEGQDSRSTDQKRWSVERKGFASVGSHARQAKHHGQTAEEIIRASRPVFRETQGRQAECGATFKTGTFQISRRPSSARVSVSSSVYSMSPPIGRP